MHNLCNDNLLTRDLFLSFGNARAQYEHLKQQEALHLKVKYCLKSVVSSRPAAVPITFLHIDCHLYGCWPLAGRVEYWCLPFPLRCP